MIEHDSLIDYVPLHWAWGHFSVVYRQALITIATKYHGNSAKELAAMNWESLGMDIRDKIYMCLTKDALPHCREQALVKK